MSRRACRTDANHAEIRDALRKAGAMVADCSKAGDGFPDLVLLHRGIVTLVEVKDGAKPPSERKLTADQVIFHGKAALQGVTVHVVTNIDEALALAQ